MTSTARPIAFQILVFLVVLVVLSAMAIWLGLRLSFTPRQR
jgi:hypothetical protein